MGVLKEFYTIREVSSIAGVTVQSVYSRLEKAEKDKYCMISLICGIKKNTTNY